MWCDDVLIGAFEFVCLFVDFTSMIALCCVLILIMMMYLFSDYAVAWLQLLLLMPFASDWLCNDKQHAHYEFKCNFPHNNKKMKSNGNVYTKYDTAADFIWSKVNANNDWIWKLYNRQLFPPFHLLHCAKGKSISILRVKYRNWISTKLRLIWWSHSEPNQFHE